MVSTFDSLISSFEKYDDEHDDEVNYLNVIGNILYYTLKEIYSLCSVLIDTFIRSK